MHQAKQKQGKTPQAKQCLTLESKAPKSNHVIFDYGRGEAKPFEGYVEPTDADLTIGREVLVRIPSGDGGYARPVQGKITGIIEKHPQNGLTYYDTDEVGLVRREDIVGVKPTLTLESKTQEELDAERAKAKQDAAMKERAERPIKGSAGEVGQEQFDLGDTNGDLFNPVVPNEANSKKDKVDSQGNPVNADGTLKADIVNDVADITNEDFTKPQRNIQLPKLAENVDAAIGAEGKPVVIKKNILERNQWRHPDITPEQSRDILKAALYSPDLYGQTQKSKRPYNWVVINVRDNEGKNRLVLPEVNRNKDNVEVVHWHYIDERGIKKLEKQAAREDGQLLILPSANAKEVGALSDPTSGTERIIPQSEGKNQVGKQKKLEALESAYKKVAAEQTEVTRIPKVATSVPSLEQSDKILSKFVDKTGRHPTNGDVLHANGMAWATDGNVAFLHADKRVKSDDRMVSFSEGMMPSKHDRSVMTRKTISATTLWKMSKKALDEAKKARLKNPSIEVYVVQNEKNGQEELGFILTDPSKTWTHDIIFSSITKDQFRTAKHIGMLNAQKEKNIAKAFLDYGHDELLLSFLDKNEINRNCVIIMQNEDGDKVDTALMMPDIGMGYYYSDSGMNKALKEYEAKRGGSGAVSFDSPEMQKRNEQIRREYDAVVAAYTNADGTKKPTWMKTPNGKKTKLTERQWVQVRTPAFKAWFGDWENDPANASKVVDANGEPIVVYHGSPNFFHAFKNSGGKYYFMRKESLAKQYEARRNMLWISDSPSANTYGCFINLKNPGIIDAHSKYNRLNRGMVKHALGLETNSSEFMVKRSRGFMGPAENEINVDEACDYAKKAGKDGLIVLQVADNIFEDNYLKTDEYIAFSPNQIKSATDNIGSFDSSSDDINWDSPELARADVANSEVGHALEDRTSEVNAVKSAAPKKTRKAFKLFRKYEDGTYGALFVDSANRYKVGEWYQAKAPDVEILKDLEGDNSKIGKVYLVDGKNVTPIDKVPSRKMIDEATAQGKRYMSIKTGANGKNLIYNLGINGSGAVAPYAYRPGWHSTNAPSAAHIGPSYGVEGKVDATGQNHYRTDDQVWCEIEIPDGIDYNHAALKRASFLKAKGREGEKNRKEAQLDYIPQNGSYFYRTNSNADEKQDWIISGAIKIVRELPREEVNVFNRENGFTPDAPLANNKAEAEAKRDAKPSDVDWDSPEMVVNPNLEKEVSAVLNTTDRTSKDILPRSRTIKMSNTPMILRFLGMPNAKIISRADILRKVNTQHRMDAKAIASLPIAYSKPVAVFRDGNNFIVLTSMMAKTNAGIDKPVMVYLRPSEERDTFLASAYAREANKEQAYIAWAKEGRLVYLDKEKVAAINLEEETDSQLTPQGGDNLVKTPEDFSSFVSAHIIPQDGRGSQGGISREGKVNFYTPDLSRDWDKVTELSRVLNEKGRDKGVVYRDWSSRGSYYDNYDGASIGAINAVGDGRLPLLAIHSIFQARGENNKHFLDRLFTKPENKPVNDWRQKKTRDVEWHHLGGRAGYANEVYFQNRESPITDVTIFAALNYKQGASAEAIDEVLRIDREAAEKLETLKNKFIEEHPKQEEYLKESSRSILDPSKTMEAKRLYSACFGEEFKEASRKITELGQRRKLFYKQHSPSGKLYNPNLPSDKILVKKWDKSDDDLFDSYKKKVSELTRTYSKYIDDNTIEIEPVYATRTVLPKLYEIFDQFIETPEAQAIIEKAKEDILKAFGRTTPVEKAMDIAAGEKTLDKLVRSRVIHDVQIDWDSPEMARQVDFSTFIGELGAKKNEAIANDLKVAMDALGDRDWNKLTKEEKRKIGFATGWERGADGKWRHEWKDLDREAITKTLYKHVLDLYKQYEESPAEYIPAKLDKFLSPELKEAYPDLAEVNLHFMRKGEGGTYASAGYNTIMVYPVALESQEEFIDTLTHEIQHLIQDKEGFAQGSNYASEWRQSKDLAKKHLADAIFSAVKNYVTAEGEVDLKRESILWNIDHEYFDNIISDTENGDWIIPASNVDKLLRTINMRSTDLTGDIINKVNFLGQDEENFGKFYAELTEKTRKPLQEMKEFIGNKKYPVDPMVFYNRYHRSAGEVEARNAASREYDATNKHDLIEDTEDVPRSEQIVRFDSPEMAEKANSFARAEYEAARAKEKLANPDVQTVMDMSQGKWETTRVLFQDAKLPILALEKELEKRTGHALNKKDSIYYAKDFEFGKNEYELTVLQKKRIDPIFKKMMEYGLTQEAVDMYLTARHFCRGRDA